MQEHEDINYLLNLPTKDIYSEIVEDLNIIINSMDKSIIFGLVNLGEIFHKYEDVLNRMNESE